MAAIETFTDCVKFIQGVTKLNQTNWQTYFGGALPNGLYEGLMVQNFYGSNLNTWVLTDGKAIVNGLLVDIKTDAGYTDIGTCTAQGIKDRFICLRVYLKEEKAQIYQVSNIATWSSTLSTWNQNCFDKMQYMLNHEDAYCTRNNDYYDLPLFYGCDETSTYWLSEGRNLGRYVKPNKQIEQDPRLYGINDSTAKGVLISGRNNYSFRGTENYLYMDTLDHPDGAIFITQNNVSDIDIYLGTTPWMNWLHDYENQVNGYGVGYIFADPTGWTNTNNGYFKYTVPANSGRMTAFRFTHAYNVTKSMPSVYTKYYLVEVL